LKYKAFLPLVAVGVVAVFAAVGGAASSDSPQLTNVPTANTKATGYAPASRLSAELSQIVLAQGSMKLENPSGIITNYGYENDTPSPTDATVPLMVGIGAGPEAQKTEPDKNTYLVFKNVCSSRPRTRAHRPTQRRRRSRRPSRTSRAPAFATGSITTTFAKRSRTARSASATRSSAVSKSTLSSAGTFAVKVVDAAGAVFPGAAVTFSATGGATTNPTAVTTDANGIAQTTGPKISSRTTFMSGVVSVSTVGSTKYPRSPARPPPAGA